MVLTSFYIISKGNKQTKKAYAYEIHVTQSWNRTEVVYEDVFDLSLIHI